MDFFIVTPSYNQRRFLQQCVESVLRQTGNFGIEYRVFDGKSTDGSQTILKKFGKKLQWQSKKDRGQTDAINKGVKALRLWLAKTKKNPDEVIFAYLNSDDYYLPGTLATAQRLFAVTRRNWLIGDCVIVNEKGHPTHRFVRWYKKLWRFWLFRPLLLVLNPIAQPGVFIRASQILKTGLFDTRLRYVMDYDYWLRLFATGWPLLTDATVAAFRIHGASKGGSQFRQQFAEQYKVARRSTKNPVILGLHRLHNAATIAVYQLIK